MISAALRRFSIGHFGIGRRALPVLLGGVLLAAAPAARAQYGCTSGPSTDTSVTATLKKGESCAQALEDILASAKEHDRMELDPARKGLGGYLREIRDPDLVMDRDVVLEDAPLWIALNALCEATGGAMLFQEPSEDPLIKTERLVLFRNTAGSIREVFYSSHVETADLLQRLKAKGVVFGPGEGIMATQGRSFMVRAGNRCHAAIGKVLEEAAKEGGNEAAAGR